MTRWPLEKSLSAPPVGRIPGFVEFWYPKKMRPADRLGWYAQYFNMVEVNSTFYSVPEPTLVRRWCDVTPPRLCLQHQIASIALPSFNFREAATPGAAKKLRLEKNAKVATHNRDKRRSAAGICAFPGSPSSAEKLGVLLLQLSPAFSPRKHRLNELENVLAIDRRFSGRDRIAKPKLGRRRAA